MKYCKKCQIETDTTSKTCPLCYNDLEEVSDEKTNSFYPARVNNDRSQQSTFFLGRVFLVASICILAICGFVNFLTFQGSVWSLLVLASVLYVWITVSHTILSKNSVFEKIFFQFVGLVVLLLCSETVSGGGNWLCNYVIPSLSMATALTLVCISLFSPKRQNFLLSFLVIYVILLVVPIVFILTHMLSFYLLNEICILVMGLSALGTLVLGFKPIKNEIQKKFHI